MWLRDIGGNSGSSQSEAAEALASSTEMVSVSRAEVSKLKSNNNESEGDSGDSDDEELIEYGVDGTDVRVAGVCVSVASAEVVVVHADAIASVKAANTGGPGDFGDFEGEMVGLDSMCSHSVTGSLLLVNSIIQGGHYRIHGWNEESEMVHEEGQNRWLGVLIFTKSASRTLSSYYMILDHIDVEWSTCGRVAVFRHKECSEITFTAKLDSNPGSRLLLVPLADLLAWNDIVDTYADQEEAELVEGSNGMEVEMSVKDYRAALQYIAFHNLHHISDGVVAHGIEVGNFRDYPWTRRVIELAQVVRGSCLQCLAAKMEHKSTKTPKRNKQEASEPELAREEKRQLMVRFSELLGVDLMFIDGETFLIGVGKLSGMVCVVHVLRKTTEAIGVALKMVINDFKRARIYVDELFNMYEWSREAELRTQLAEEQTLTEVMSDGEGAILALVLKLLEQFDSAARVGTLGQHVTFVERPIRTIQTRVKAMRVGLRFKLSQKMIIWLVINVVNWRNQYPDPGRRMSGWSYHNAMKLLFSDVTRGGYGRAVVAYRPVARLTEGQPRGEAGISLGFNPRYPGSIFFLSTATDKVKSRARFSMVPDTDLVARYGRNEHYVPPGVVKPRNKLVIFAEDRVAQMPFPSPDRTYSPPVACLPQESEFDDEDSYGVPVDHSWEPSSPAAAGGGASSPALTVGGPVPSPMTAPAPWSGVTPGTENGKSPLRGLNLRSAIEEAAAEMPSADEMVPASVDPVGTGPREKDTQRDVIPAVRVSARNQKGRTSLFEDYVTKHVVAKVCSVNWGQAAASDQSEEKRREIEASHDKEVDGLLQNDVFEPSDLDPDTVEYFNSKDLFDWKLNGKAKSRVVVAMQKRKRGQAFNPIDLGIDTYAPTLDLKVIFLMLSLCLEFDLCCHCVWSLIYAVTVSGV